MPKLTRDILNRLGQRLRIEFEHISTKGLTPRMDAALDKLPTAPHSCTCYLADIRDCTCPTDFKD